MKKTVLVNTAKPDLTQMALAAGHRLTNIHSRGGRTLADLDGERMPVTEIRRWLKGRYRFEQMSNADRSRGTGTELVV